MQAAEKKLKAGNGRPPAVAGPVRHPARTVAPWNPCPVHLLSPFLIAAECPGWPVKMHVGKPISDGKMRFLNDRNAIFPRSPLSRILTPNIQTTNAIP